jgi:hypothetical protein
VLILPLLALMFLRREIPRLLVTGALFVAVVGGLFAWNAAITGDINFQGGNRKSFYSSTGFPFANTWETFDKVGQGITTNDVPLDILLHHDTIRVFPRNLMYFTFGRYSGLLPYFFPGVLAAILFLAEKRHRERWQWPVAAGLAIGMVGLLLYMPYTYSGGGGPIGNRYFLSFYPLFLFLMPPVRSVVAPIVALAIGSLFVAKLVLNPFYTSFNPGQHAKAGPLRLLPIELTLLNDLPVAADIDRARRSLGVRSASCGIFPDDGAYLPEGDSFWVRRGSRADVVLRAPAPPGSDGSPVPHRIRRLSLQVTNGAAPNRITVSAGVRRVTFDLKPGETRPVDIEPAGGGLPPIDSPHQLRLFVRRIDLGRVRAIPRGAGQHRQPLPRGAGQGYAGLLTPDLHRDVGLCGLEPGEILEHVAGLGFFVILVVGIDRPHIVVLAKQVLHGQHRGHHGMILVVVFVHAVAACTCRFENLPGTCEPQRAPP